MEAETAVEDEPVGSATDDGRAEGDEGFVRNESAKEHGSRFSLASAFKCAASGVVYAVRTQRNMKIHLVIAVIAVTLGFVLHIGEASWAAVILCIAAVFAAECLNTAVESVVDLVSPDYHVLARRAKDCAAGTVLIFAVVSLVVAVVVFGPPAWTLLFG